MTKDNCCDVGNELLRADLSEAAIEAAVAGFNALWQGRSAAPAELLQGREDVAAEVLTALAAKGRVDLDESGRLVGVHGLTLRTTRHRFHHAGRDRWTWCAFDSVGIPAALRLDATAHSDCPTCGRALRIEMRAGIPEDSSLVLWLPSGDVEHLMNDFCASADLYCSLDHLRRRIDVGSVRGSVADLAEAVALGCDTWRHLAHAGEGRIRDARDV